MDRKLRGKVVPDIQLAILHLVGLVQTGSAQSCQSSRRAVSVTRI